METLVFVDWGKDPRKRWEARVIREGVRARATAPAPVLDAERWLAELLGMRAADHTVLVGVDFALGVPSRFAVARRPRIRAFVPFLAKAPASFFGEVRDLERVSPATPFFRSRSGQRFALDDLARRLGARGGARGADGWRALLRRCERGHPGRPRDACPVFVPRPTQDVTGATRTGWLEVVRPALSAGAKLWPFDGDLEEVARPGAIVLAETYPAEVSSWIGLPEGKRSAEGRAPIARALARAIRAAGLHPAPELARDLAAGFPDRPGALGEDRLDAVVGALGLALARSGAVDARAPRDHEVREVEGWILGRPSDALSTGSGRSTRRTS